MIQLSLLGGVKKISGHFMKREVVAAGRKVGIL